MAGCAWATVAVGFQLGFQLGYPAAPGRGYHQITVQRVVGDPNAGTTLTTSPAARPVTPGPTDSVVPAASRPWACGKSGVKRSEERRVGKEC